MIEVTRFTLDNGLRVVHNYHPQAILSAVELVYDTGSRDERSDCTGIAHLFEHLMFGGTPAVPEYDVALEKAGGVNNAATSHDVTFFYDVLPVQNIETAFWLESDRMRGLSFSEKSLEVQRHVVIEEFKETTLNSPYGGVNHAMHDLLYTHHPYRWPVIGLTPDHIAAVTRDDVKRWFYSHYAPNNAILSVVGNISAERVKEMAEKWFGSVPAAKIEPRRNEMDPWLTEPRRTTIYDKVPQTLINIAFRMDPYGTRGYLAADAISDILANGQSSRLKQRLVRGSKLFTSADAAVSGFDESGFFIISARLADESDEALAKAEEMLLEQVRRIAEPGNVTEEELERAKNVYDSSFTFGNIMPVRKVHNIAMAEYHHEDINEMVPMYRSLSLDEIAQEARRLFVDHAPAVVVCRPLEQNH